MNDVGGVGAASTVVTLKSIESNLLFAPGTGSNYCSLFLCLFSLMLSFFLFNIARTFEFAFDAPLTPFELECLHVVLQLVKIRGLRQNYF